MIFRHSSVHDFHQIHIYRYVTKIIFIDKSEFERFLIADQFLSVFLPNEDASMASNQIERIKK